MNNDTLLTVATFSYEKIPTLLCPSALDASKTIAIEIANIIKTKNALGLPAVLGLATGSTPKRVYKELIQMYRDKSLSFANVICFNLDEYYQLHPENAGKSYYQYMRENLFKHIDVQDANCYIPNGQIELEDIKRHCEEYEKKIDEAGGLDFQLLGIGRNGHIGFNEPGSHINSVTRLITLEHTTRSDAAYEFGSMSNVPRKAITMGVKTILKAKRILLVALGEGKAAIIKKAVEGPVTEFVPTSYLQGHHNTMFILDEAASSELTRIKTPWLTDEVTWNIKLIKKAVTHLSVVLGKPILKLTATDYNGNGLSDLLTLYGQVHDLNIFVFNQLQHTITGWPGGKPNADDSNRPERALPFKKRVLIFSPHPDDDIISMGGTFQRLVDHGHEVHIAYQTSGNIAVADDEAFRFIEFVKEYNDRFNIKSPETDKLSTEALEFLDVKKDGEKDIPALRYVKGLIRKSEAKNTCRFVGVPMENAHFLNLPFYETGTIEKKPIGDEDYKIIADIIEEIQPHQIFAAGDLADPHGTHKVCLDGVFEAVNRLKDKDFMKDCWVWLYKGAWAEWDIDLIEMVVPMSPDQVLKKRNGIFKHQSQKDGVVFQGSNNKEFWQRAEERNSVACTQQSSAYRNRHH